MWETVFTILMALISGLLGAGITLLWNQKEIKRKDKLDILTVLLSYRGRGDVYALSQLSPAINRIDIVFSDDQPVLAEVKNFINKRTVFDLANKSESEMLNINKAMDESYTRLVTAIAGSLNYKNITFDIVSTPYNPQGVSDYFALQDATVKIQLGVYQTIMNNQQRTD